VVDLADGDAGVPDRLVERRAGAVEQVLREALELRARVIVTSRCSGPSAPAVM
jgi:NAD-specific glutamate dehydrogenase.